MEGKERVRVIRKKLYDASLSGDVESLKKLMEEDKLTLARDSTTCFNETPLHIASMLGHLAFAKVLLDYKPDLVRKLDSQGRSPLHLASANGYVEIVKLLLMVNSNVCLTRDEDNRTPLHLAVMNGKVDVVKELIRARSDLTQYTMDRGETILHSCVIYNRLEALKLIIEMSRVDDFVNVRDANGYSILHTATALKQKETIRYLVSKDNVRVNAVNENGLTALDIIEQMPRDLKSMEIRELLVTTAKGLKAKKTSELRKTINSTHQGDPNEKPPINQCCEAVTPLKKGEEWLEKKRDAIMVAATVTAAMAFQAGINPPSGVWQDTKTVVRVDRNTTYRAGTSIMDPDAYATFSIFNTISFVGSLSIVLLLVSGLPLKRRLFMWFLMVAMCLTMTFMTITYLFSLAAIAPDNAVSQFSVTDISQIIYITLFAWVGLICIIFLWHTCRFIIWTIKKLLKCCTKKGVQSRGVHRPVLG